MLSSIMQLFNGGIKTSRLLVGLKAAITAGASGIANAVGFKDMVGIYTTVAASGTGKMPFWQTGRIAVAINQGANSITLYSAEGATVPVGQTNIVQFQPPLQSSGLTAGTTGISLGAGKSMWFIGSMDPNGVYPVWNELSAPGN